MLVEAAAGTGKTTLIMDRMLHGLKRGAFRLPRTVAITFTEKAAGELETRLRAALARELRTSELTPSERHNLNTAIEEIDRVNVSTIHSFCAGLLRERPVDAGVDPEFEVLDEVRSDMLAQECWGRWMAGQVQKAPDPLVEALKAGVSTETGRRSPGLRGLAGALMATPEALEPARTALPTPDSSSSELAQRLRDLAPEVRSFLETHRKTGGNKTYHMVMDFLQSVEEASELSRVCRLACSFPAEKSQKALTSLERDSRERAGELLDQIASAADLISAHLAADVFHWISEFAEFYTEEKRRRSVLDFQDLLVLAARMLRSRPALRDYYKRRFDAFFVDEFQDTDPLQAEIVAFLCERPGEYARELKKVDLQPGKLFVVGDPKQSIYRFRRADVQTYERFKNLLKGQSEEKSAIRQIHCNFRSTRPVLNELNDIFSHIFVPSHEEGVYQAEHVALSAPPEAPARTGQPGIKALCPPPDLIEELDSAGTARDYEAHYLALAIKSQVERNAGDGNRAYGDFACLFRAMTDVEKYEEAFEKYGIPYRVIGGRTYYRTEEIGETIALLRAIDDPLDQPAIVGALRSSYFGVSDEELLDFERQGGRWNYLNCCDVKGPAADAMRALEEWHERRNTVAPHVLLEEVLHRTKALESFLLKPQGRQRTANVKKLLGQLRNVWSASHGSFGSVVDYLASLQEREAREEESSVVEPGDDFVQIMTIHKSKGLQFPCVVLPDLSRKLPRDTDPVLLDRSSGRVEVSVSSSISSRGYQELSEVESRNLQAEFGRLLYVACTRAEESLILPLYWHKPGRGAPSNSLLSILESTERFEPAGEVPYGKQIGGIFYADTRQWQSRISLRPMPREWKEKDEGPSSKSLLKKRKQWQRDRGRLLSRAKSAPPIVSPSTLDAENRPALAVDQAESGGKNVGSLFHQVMRRIPLEGDTDGAEFKQLVRQTALHLANDRSLSPDDIAHTVEMACSAVRNPDFRHLVGAAEYLGREVPFCVPLRQLPFEDMPARGFLEGSIDLLVRGPDGTVVVDYKTDRAAVSNLETLKQHYWPQLALYGLACESCQLAPSPQLILYFVRPGTMCARNLDEDLLRTVHTNLREKAGNQDRLL